MWVDVTEIEAHVKRARRLEQFGEDGLSEWQAAYDLAMRGSFLPEEIYSDWAQWRRQRVETHLWECVQALWRRAAEQGKAGETEAIRILREYWHSHQTNEDALRPLLELLGKHECFGEAQTCYDQLCAALIEEGKQPDQRTRDIIEFLQAVQLQRKRITVDIVKEPSHLLTAPPLNNAPHDWFPEGHEERGESSFPFFSLPQTDSDILSRFVTTLNHLPIVREKEVSYFDQQTRLYWYAREETALSAATLCSSVLKHIDALTLLLSRSHSPTLRLYLCEIACRTVLLAGILHYDMGQYTKARHYYHAAFQAATEANNPMLQAIVWGWVSFTWTYAKCYTEALHCIQWARRCATQTADIMVQAWLGAIEAEIQAHLQNREACVRALDRIEQGMACSPSQDTSYLFEFHPVLLLGYKGVCLQQFYQRSVPATHSLLQEAQQSLELALASEAPPKRKLYYLNDLAGIYARQGEAEKACASILQTIPAIKRMGSGSKTLQSHVLQAHALLQPYRTTAVVRALDEQMAALLSG
ncbi:MAG TPA: bacterial transcriptional activator domain-containing protein [Ktedonobacteraceae bacterium]|nr:bacterial transcriptional activator domain-containing protein [Ktedonobacteraceae bacterium]